MIVRMVGQCVFAMVFVTGGSLMLAFPIDIHLVKRKNSTVEKPRLNLPETGKSRAESGFVLSFVFA